MLVLCTACSRHARAEEARCPFCGGALAPPKPYRRPSRAGRAAILFGATLAGSAAGCGGPQAAEPTTVEEPPPDDGPPDDGNVVPEYGVPADVESE
jgi:hypothetical protein